MKTIIYRLLLLLFFVSNYTIVKGDCDCNSINLAAKANLELDSRGIVFVSYTLIPLEGHNPDCAIESVTAVTEIADTGESVWQICAYNEGSVVVEDENANPFTAIIQPNGITNENGDFALNPTSSLSNPSKIVITLGGITGGGGGTGGNGDGNEIGGISVGARGVSEYRNPAMCGIKTVILRSVGVRVNGFDCKLSNLKGDEIDLGPCKTVIDTASEGYVEETFFNKRILTTEETGVLYPNPSSDIVNVSFADKEIENIEVLDTSGKVVQHINGGGDSTQRINVAAYPKGVYIFKISTSKGVYTRRLLKI